MKKVPESQVSEALYTFMGWLTTRKDRLVLSAADDAAPAAEVIDEFCKANNIPEPGNLNDDWPYHHPTSNLDYTTPSQETR